MNAYIFKRFATICYHTTFQNATFTAGNIVSITRTAITVMLVTLAVRN